VGVFATLCRGDMATLIDAKLYLPEAWCNDDERCKKAAIPQDKRQFQSKTKLAWQCFKSPGSAAFNSAMSALTEVTAKNRLFCVASMTKAADLSRMSIAIQRFICKTRNRWCPSGQVAAGSPAIVNLNLLRNPLIHERPTAS